jgi:hypothetical protein
MTTRRDFIVTTIGAAASLRSSFGQSVVRSKTKGQQMQDQAEDPRITRARLSGPKQVTAASAHSQSTHFSSPSAAGSEGEGAGRGNVVLPPGARPAYDAQYIGEPHGSPN